VRRADPARDERARDRALAGLHTGEVRFEDDDVTGIAVAIGARVVQKAGANEVLVSQTCEILSRAPGSLLMTQASTS
jgi:class 3 adenylate cyclase